MKRLPAITATLGLLASFALHADDPVLRIGSKNFTESIVLAEILRLDAARAGLKVEHHRAMGGSAILWQALQDGSIDAYPEYTGTLSQELLHGVPPAAAPAELAAALAARGIGISASLGFDDSYALGVSAALAARLGLHRLSDLRRHPELRYALSNEFMSRGDGWPGLRAAYGFVPRSVQGMDHGLAYRALAGGAADVIDLYTTDAEIANDQVQVLDDDLRYFPSYEAVWLYRLDSAQRLPQLAATLSALAGRIGRAPMREMNAAVKFGARDEADVAAAFLGLAQHGGSGLATRLRLRTLEHLRLVGISLALALLAGLPLGILAAKRPRLGQITIAATALLQTLPSLALFVFLIPLLGIGAKPAIAALFLYSLLPIVRNTQTGLATIEPSLRESAASLGLPWTVQLWRVELPLALRTILAGISTAAVINVGTATLGALIGAGGYGEPILTGIRLDNIALILEGAVPASLLALLVLAAFQLLERALTPRGLRQAARR
ncbi:MAG: glycine betaine ABC transporter substrate-binding protein [Nevskia sp.]